MANSKVELANGEVLIDLTGDTVSNNNIIAGTVAHTKSGEQIVGDNTNIVDTSDANAAAGQIYVNCSAYTKGQKINGTLPRGRMSTDPNYPDPPSSVLYLDAVLSSTTESITCKYGLFKNGVITHDNTLVPFETKYSDFGSTSVSTATISQLKTQYNSVVCLAVGGMGYGAGNDKRLTRLNYIAPHTAGSADLNFYAGYGYQKTEYTGKDLSSSNVTFSNTACVITLPTNAVFKHQYIFLFFKL